MLLLAIDTATRRVGAAFASDHGVLGRVEVGGPGDSRPRHAEALVPAIEYLANECAVRLDQLSAIAVGTGPGMFTGLRVGVTTARASPSRCGYRSFRLRASICLRTRYGMAGRSSCPAIDARRNEVYYAIYRPVPGGVQRESEYELGTPEDLASELEARGVDALLCGDGAVRFADAFRHLDRVEFAGTGHVAPSLSALVELAIPRFEREQFCAADEVRPIYLRQSDAEISWEGKM